MPDKHFRLRILIVGAGLGGLSAAISCAVAGHDVIVFEGAKQLAEVCCILVAHRKLFVNTNGRLALDYKLLQTLLACFNAGDLGT